MTDTKPLAPTDAEIVALADETRTAEGGANGYILPISFARAVLARWGAQQAPDPRPVIEMCKKALAEELAAWDIDPPLHHVLEAHDACAAWLAAAPQPVVREPLTEDQALDAFCRTPRIHQFVQAFMAGVRFAEQHHGIKGGQHGAE